MFRLIPADPKIDFMGRAPMMMKISAITVLAALAVLLIPGLGLKFGLDFSGGHEVLLRFENAPSSNDVRAALVKLQLGDTSVQSYATPPDDSGTFYLVRVQRAEVLSPEAIERLRASFAAQYGDQFSKIDYDPNVGSVIDVSFAVSGTVATSSVGAGRGFSDAQLIAAVENAGQHTRRVRKMGRPDQAEYSIVLRGVDHTIVEGLKAVDPSVDAVRVEFVGPTVGKQLRDDGILAMIYALLGILIYIALRFDFFYSPGAVFCLFHDAMLTMGILAVFGHEFSLATVAGILTLVGYSINDTIVIFDRIRELVGKQKGEALKALVNRALNETLARTVLTASTTFGACICLAIFGRGTVLADFGLIMGVGVIVGTYSSIFIAAPIFVALRERFGADPVTERKSGPSGRTAQV